MGSGALSAFKTEASKTEKASGLGDRVHSRDGAASYAYLEDKDTTPYREIYKGFYANTSLHDLRKKTTNLQLR